MSRRSPCAPFPDSCRQQRSGDQASRTRALPARRPCDWHVRPERHPFCSDSSRGQLQGAGVGRDRMNIIETPRRRPPVWRTGPCGTAPWPSRRAASSTSAGPTAQARRHCSTSWSGFDATTNRRRACPTASPDPALCLIPESDPRSGTRGRASARHWMSRGHPSSVSEGRPARRRRKLSVVETCTRAAARARATSPETSAL
jgi:hypothetical protein